MMLGYRGVGSDTLADRKRHDLHKIRVAHPREAAAALQKFNDQGYDVSAVPVEVNTSSWQPKAQ